MRKPAFCICENKNADQLRRNCAADQHLCFRYMDSAIPLLSKSKISSLIFCGCTAPFVSDLVKNPEDSFSHNEAHMVLTGQAVLERYLKIMVKIYVYIAPGRADNPLASNFIQI